MRLCDLLSGEERLENAGADIDITSLTADSRMVSAGTLFAALPGSNVDGARFVPAAVSAGAVAVLASGAADLSVPPGVALIRSDDPRRSWSRISAMAYAPQPEHVVAVTGTNGKTSVAVFLSQIWSALGHPAASIGTLGVVCERGNRTVAPPEGVPDVKLTSPDPVVLHQALRGLGAGGYSHVAIEASSHGLEQRRVDGVELEAGAFTNITRDHLDYHVSFENYLAAKLRLFEVLLAPGKLAVVNCDGPGHEAAMAVASSCGLKLMTHGRKTGDVRLANVQSRPAGLDIEIKYGGQSWPVSLGLVGGFQAENAATALCLATASGISVADSISVLGALRGARGRLEPVGNTFSGAVAYVDFAHTPDALKTALAALRPHVSGRIITVFGAGGDRDPGKRPLMGAAAAAGSDAVIVTDDNPRSEDPGAIRAAVLVGCPEGVEIGDRAEAIAAALSQAGDGDAVLVAGKGHETGQTICGVVHPFSDHDVIADVLAGAFASGGHP